MMTEAGGAAFLAAATGLAAAATAGAATAGAATAAGATASTALPRLPASRSAAVSPFPFFTLQHALSCCKDPSLTVLIAW